VGVVVKFATAGTIYGMTHKTTIYLPQELKAAVEREAHRRGTSEAAVIRHAITSLVARPEPTVGFIEGEPIAERVDEHLAGFGER
jgi:predicted transcriptional regulator